MLALLSASFGVLIRRNVMQIMDIRTASQKNSLTHSTVHTVANLGWYMADKFR